ncbi:hypothetical protein AGMMS4957_10660 [Bacteroidia bacterium]|nr:hypothetical protein AGMMS4957_10660 [Bacteroidia bacterium]
MAFYGCIGLKEIHSENPTPPTVVDPTNTFANVDRTTCKLYVPKGSLAAYKAAYGWMDFFNIIEEGTTGGGGTVPGTSWNIGYPVATDVIATLSEDKKALVISGTGAMQDWDWKSLGAGYAPWYDNKNRTSTITTVIIQDGVTSIGNHAFAACTLLTSITIPNSVTSIGTSAFFECNVLTWIAIPDNVTSIGIEAFDGCVGLTSIVIPNGVTSIGNGTFYGCRGLTSVIIGNNVNTIGGLAFYNCTGLKEIYSNNPTPPNIDKTYTFAKVNNASCKLYVPKGSLAAYKATDGWRDFFNILEEGTTGGGETVPDTSWNIGYPTATDVTATLSEDKKTLVISGRGAMQDWDGQWYNVGQLGQFLNYAPWYDHENSTITTVIIQDGVTSIGNLAFAYCTSLTSITLPNSVTSIGTLAFWQCDVLTGIAIPDNVTSIENNAFQRCNVLTSIVIPNGVTSIEHNTFSNCSGLTSVTIGNSVTSIGDYAFSNCSGLTSVIIPNSVTSISPGAFYGCSGLTEIHCNNPTPPNIDAVYSFLHVNKASCKLYVPAGSLVAYKATDGWRDFFNIIEEGATAITPIDKDKIAIYNIPGGIAIETEEATPISIFNVTGQKVHQSVVTGSAEIHLNKGVYIVKANNGSRKVIVM